MNCGDDRDLGGFAFRGCRRKRSAWRGNPLNAKTAAASFGEQSKNETHRGCRSPGGFFYCPRPLFLFQQRCFRQVGALLGPKGVGVDQHSAA